MVSAKDLHNHYTKYFFALFFILFLYLSFLIIQPFIATVIFGVIVAYIANPLYAKLGKHMKNPSLRAFAVSLLLIILIITIAVTLVNSLLKETTELYLQSKKTILRGEITAFQCEKNDERIICKINEILENPRIRIYISDAFTKILTVLSEKASEFIISIPKIIIGAFITIMTTFYCLRDGSEFMKRLRKIIPLKLVHQDELLKQINDVIFAVLFGSLIVAMVQGSLGAVGFFLFGIKSPIFWGMIMAVFALIPMVGTGLIWAPAALFLAIAGYAQGDSIIMWKGVGLFLYGFFVVGSIDNIIRPYIVSERAGVHPLFIFLGALGGIIVFGVVGFILGPLILALFKTLFEMYEKERIPHTR